MNMIPVFQAAVSPYSWELEHLWVPLILLIGYFLCIGPLRRFFPNSAPVSLLKIQLFVFGIVLTIVAVVSPVEALSVYLLTMHMIQHLIITMLAVPLMIVGTPRWFWSAVFSIPGVLPIAKLIFNPIAGFLVFNMIFSLWHIPRYYDLALTDPAVHQREHIMFFFAAVMSWWPVFSTSVEIPRLSDPLLIVYLFLQSLPPTILGAVITFAGDILYPSYASAPRLWGLSAELDQQIGGLIMWMPGALVYLTVLSWIFFRWLNRGEHERSEDFYSPALHSD